VYTTIVQNHLAPTGYVKISTVAVLSRYHKGASFLPRLNNEIAKTHNEKYIRSSIDH
jgi:hypothetical protein